MRPTWKTKYGTRRVRHDPPTLAEAIEAAKDITDDPQAMAEFAASLMGVPVEEAQDAVAKVTTKRSRLAPTIAFTSRAGAQRAVVVERKRAVPRMIDRSSWQRT
jgi:hypothetical protein